jgi:glycosyltransferase involved in cell wall biosynthesis
MESSGFAGNLIRAAQEIINLHRNDGKSLKKVLIISYIFPPIGGSGVQRTTKFVKYLPQFGWQPLVVCGDNGDVFQDGYDPSLLMEIPEQVQVWRTKFISPLTLRRTTQRILGSKNSKVFIHSDKARKDPADNQNLKRSKISGLLHHLSTPLAPFEFPPIDAALYWALSIVSKCKKIIASEGVDLVYTTSFPYSDHVAGYLLKRMTGKPWIADFRDPWSQNPAARNTGWRGKCDRWMEQLVLQNADRMIAVTPAYTEGLRSLVPNRQSRDFITIENGFDNEDFEENKANHGEKSGEFTPLISHIGKVYNGTEMPFLCALKNIRPGTSLLVKFIGGMAENGAAFLNTNPLPVPLQILDRISHAEAVHSMRSADVLLLLVDSWKDWAGHYPGRLFEYMASGTPILMIGPEGEASGLVQSSGTGCFVPSCNEDQIVDILHMIANDLDKFRSQYYNPNWDVINRYERRALTSRLVSAFDELLEHREEHETQRRHAVS